MSSHVQVILLEDVPSLGRHGDIVRVAEGYARNALFPDGKAALATEQVRSQQQTKKDREKETDAAQLAQLQALAQKLDGTELTIAARVKDAEDIFGKVTARTIAQELKKQAKIAVKPAHIELPDSITTLGSRDVVLHLSPAVEAKLRVTIVPDAKSSRKEPEEE